MYKFSKQTPSVPTVFRTLEGRAAVLFNKNAARQDAGLRL